jgi:hypothetical protein
VISPPTAPEAIDTDPLLAFKELAEPIETDPLDPTPLDPLLKAIDPPVANDEKPPSIDTIPPGDLAPKLEPPAIDTDPPDPASFDLPPLIEISPPFPLIPSPAFNETLPPILPAPEIKDRSPPTLLATELEADPETMSTDPAFTEALEPTFNEMEPAAPIALLPVWIFSDPEFVDSEYKL